MTKELQRLVARFAATPLDAAAAGTGPAPGGRL